MACIKRPATITCPNSLREAGHTGRTMSTISTMHAMPNRKRTVRKVNGGAYCMPILDARKPEPQMDTKYQARNESNQRRLAMAGITKIRVYLAACCAIAAGAGQSG